MPKMTMRNPELWRMENNKWKMILFADDQK
jgi:hypothetical protein